MSSLRILRHFTLLLALSSLVFAGGCGIFSPDEKKEDGGGGGTQYVENTTPDAVIANFITAYNAMDDEYYWDLRHPDFKFEFASADVVDLGLPSGELDWQEDGDNTARMFNGEPGDGVGAIQSIDLQLDAEGQWSGNVEQSFPDGTLKRSYSVTMNVTFTDGNTQPVSGIQDFYVISDGAGGWLLRHWRDNGV